MGKYLGFDYGRKFIGVAEADTSTNLALILKPLLLSKHQTPSKKVVDFINSQNKIEFLVIGIPNGIDQKPTQMSKEVTAFAKIVHQETGIPYILWDETFTSKQVEASSIKRGSKSSHSHVARIILQEFLDNKNL